MTKKVSEADSAVPVLKVIHYTGRTICCTVIRLRSQPELLLVSSLRLETWVVENFEIKDVQLVILTSSARYHLDGRQLQPKLFHA